MTQPYVLLAESNDGYSVTLRQMLKGADLRFASGASLKEARSLAILEFPSLLLLDMDQPTRESIRLLSDLRTRGMSAPVLWLSSTVTDSQLARVKASGAHGLLSKTTDSATTLRALFALLRGGEFFELEQPSRKASGIRSLTMDERLAKLLQG